MAQHSITDARWVTRLGSKEWSIRCACGIRCSHPDRDQATAAFRTYHASLLGLVPAVASA